MTNTLKSFLTGAFGLIALFLILSRSGGFARALGAGGSASSQVFKTLQGR